MKTIIFSKQAKKFLLSQSKKQATRIFDAINQMSAWDIARVEGTQNPTLFRLRVGKVRVIFCYEDEVIRVIKINNRGDVYKT